MERRWVLMLLSIAVAIGLLLALAAVAVAEDNDIVISEVLYNARCLGTDPNTCGSTGSDETRFEWAEIYNKGNSSVNLNGWQICDNRSSPTCRTIPATTIGPHECWVIGYNASATQTELNATGHGSAWNANRYIALGTAIGDGLTNEVSSTETPEGVVLKNASGATIDCVSWRASSAGSVCGSEGVNTTLNNAPQATSITNIAGSWYFHGPGGSGTEDQSSPFDCHNTARGGSPTSIGLLAFTANTSRVAFLWSIAALAALPLSFAGLAWARRGLGRGKKI